MKYLHVCLVCFDCPFYHVCLVCLVFRAHFYQCFCLWTCYYRFYRCYYYLELNLHVYHLIVFYFAKFYVMFLLNHQLNEVLFETNYELSHHDHKYYIYDTSFQFSTTSILIINIMTLQQLETQQQLFKCFETTRSCRYTTFSGLSLGRLRMAATISSEISRNYKYPYFDPTTHDWNIDTTKIKNFQFVNYINKSHNQINTLYLIFDVIPKLNYNHILPFTYSNNQAILNDNSKFSLESLMPQYLSGASQLKDVSVSIIDINKLINLFGKDNFQNIDIFYQQLDKIDKENQNQANKNKNKNKHKQASKTKVIKDLKQFIINNKLDGYIVPKNDKYFTEYSKVNNLIKITNFTGSAGFALILIKQNYLFVDGRYTIQANNQSGDKFKILEIPYVWPKNI